MARFGRVFMARRGGVGLGMARQGLRGVVGRGEAWHGKAVFTRKHEIGGTKMNRKESIDALVKAVEQCMVLPIMITVK